jgi:two-component system, cell cycle sensor histidine kinase PleC
MLGHDGENRGHDGSEFFLNPVSLRFRDAHVERRFNADHLLQALPTLRVSLLGATATYASFGILDRYIIPEASGIAAWVRYGVVCPMLLSIVLLSYATWFPRIAQLVLSTAMLVCGLGIIAMISVAGEPGRSTYYAGLILVLIIGSSIVPIGWIAVSTVSLLIGFVYQLTVDNLSPIASNILLNNDFFLFAAVSAAIGASYLQELKVRRIFIRDEGLRSARLQSDVLRSKAEEASRAKSEFLAVMSHELRTPLNAILGFSEIMKMRIFGPMGSERYAVYAEDIHNSAQHLLSIISDILDFSRAEVGALSLREEEVAIVDVLDECLRLLRGKAVDHGIRLSLEAPSGAGPIVCGDERLIKQAFLNVLGNALKFTPAGGAVRVCVEVAGERLVVRIVDTGIGIAEADLPRIFEPFVQLENAFSRKNGGAGLGLPLVKKIVDLHNGGLSIDSTLGAGTTVNMWFPAERMLTAAQQVIDRVG